jgi:hypothetical protein
VQQVKYAGALLLQRLSEMESKLEFKTSTRVNTLSRAHKAGRVVAKSQALTE